MSVEKPSGLRTQGWLGKVNSVLLDMVCVPDDIAALAAGDASPST